ncbi:MAG: SRPBCC family protein [Ectothiorhodospiraceae bacterium]|nr:SRPBCC family protein [Ectothiorhodospiraceae bacterium]
MTVNDSPANPEQPGQLLEPGVIRFERLLPGPIERVWAFLTESGKRARWLAAGEMAPRVGTEVMLEFRHVELSPETVPTPLRYRDMDQGCTTRHTITRYEPPHVLAMTWGGGSEPLSEVTFELRAEGKGQVRLVLTHRRLAGDSLQDVGCGWHAHLGVLRAVLSGVPPESFWILPQRAERVYAPLK